MNWHAEIAAEFAGQRKRVDSSVVEEMAQHAAAAFEAARAEGASVADAEASALALIQSWCRETTGPSRLDRPPLLEAAPAGRSLLAGIGLDVRLAVRLLRWQPGLAFMSIAMIALGIAAATSLFSVVSGVLLKPFPRVKLDGLVRVVEASQQVWSGQPTFSNETYHAWSEAPGTIEGLAAWNDFSLSFQGPDGLEVVRGARITASLFPVLGIAPVLGVNFSDVQELSDDTVMLSYSFWQERFGGAPQALGQQLTVGGKPRTVIGVMPRGFDFPDRESRLWLAHRPPIVRSEQPGSIAMRFTSHNALARLKPGVTPEQAASEAVARVRAGASTIRRLPHRILDDDRIPTIVVTPMLDWMIKDVKPALWILSAAVLLLFVAAIGNVANMLLARATTREREVAIRAAIGAGGGRLARQLLVETSMLSVIGGALGLGITYLLLRLLPTLMPEDFPRLDDIAIDGRAVIVTAGLTLVVSLITGLMPARLAGRVKLTTALAEDGVAPVGHGLRSPAARSRALIMTGQVAIASVLLVGAALLSQSLFRLIRVDRGYEPANLLTARLAHFPQGKPVSARVEFYQQVFDRLAARPGVTHAAFSDELPLTPAGTLPRIAGSTEENPNQALEGEVHVVTAGYLPAMGMRLVRGRGFTTDDGRTSELVVLVNETFARRYLSGDPMNARLTLDLDEDRPCGDTKSEKSGCTNVWRVVGVVADVRQAGPGAPVQPEVFAVRSQFMSPIPAQQYVTIRTTGDPAVLGNELRKIVREASTAGVIQDVQTMETRLMMSLAKPRLYAVLLVGFASFALVIAVIGLFGGLSYGVTQRTREIGVRTALGATPRHIVGMVMKQGTLMTLTGLALGLGGAAGTVRYLGTFLFGVTPLDPGTFAGVGATLLTLALVACAIPARRAAKIDALTALRQ